MIRIDEYYPLKEGRSLRYAFDGSERPDPGTAERRTEAVTPGENCLEAVWEETLRNGDEPFVRRFEARRSPEGVFEDGRWLIRAPLEAGQSWEDGPDRFEIVSVEATVEVPAGRFEDCLHVEYGNEDTGGGSLFYAPGTGLVQWKQWGERGGHTYRLTEAG